MLTSNRLDFRPYTRSASVTISNRRVRPRTHGGVAGGGGQTPPLCGSQPKFAGSGNRVLPRSALAVRDDVAFFQIVRAAICPGRVAPCMSLWLLRHFPLGPAQPPS